MQVLRPLCPAALATALLSAVLLASPLGWAAAQQAPAPPPPAQFDAATIKPSAPPASGTMFRIGMQIDPGRLTANYQSLRDLITAAYGLQDYQVEGPDWLASQRFDITAVTSAPVTRDQMMALLRTLLEQRFQLKTHAGSKTASVYNLEVAPGGSKLKPAGAKFELPPEVAKFKLNGSAIKPGQSILMMGPGGMHMLAYTNLAGLAKTLSRQTDRPVLDHTGLAGEYTVDLNYAPPAGARAGMPMMMMAARRADAPRSPGATQDSTDAAPPAPALATALESQLGLRLVPVKAPIATLVVDSALKAPLDN